MAMAWLWLQVSSCDALVSFLRPAAELRAWLQARLTERLQARWLQVSLQTQVSRESDGSAWAAPCDPAA